MPWCMQIKNFTLDILKRSSRSWTSTLVTSLDSMFDSFDAQIAGGSSAGYIFPLQDFLFTFLSRALLNADPSAVPEIKKSGYIMLDKWLALQLLPTISINVLQPLEEIFLHSFSYPFWLVKSDYQKLANFVKTEAKETVQRAQTDFNLTEEEAVHNLLFILGFNAFGGFLIFFISLLSSLGEQKSMELVFSFVYETLRLNPPVPSQFGRARKDFELSSHDAVFQIKKGEMLCGYQPLVMQDPKIFENPEDLCTTDSPRKKVAKSCSSTTDVPMVC
ncbi:UNVERIFIED_CONTAM: Fatty acid hydroperoxide lyase, chloroplastic [Sesamum radiatum]|uniref:Fatty acid hydroperoxide lyase, chloroplastic n=1 Tax=Sesamum radiatum TaxID=300843 RepID=A0AAW2KL47_SESRA